MIAGEASGDTLGEGLIRAIRKRCPDARFEGIGGPKMIAQGFESFAQMERLSVMGFVEPLARLPELLRIKRDLEQRFIRNPPDVFVGIDSPGFNLRVEQVLHDHAIPTVHYVSPSVWAWGQKRIHKIAAATDLVLALFPFETAFYEQHQVPVRFVGHPLADAIALDGGGELEKTNARVRLGLAEDRPCIALMPGSRRNEISRLGPVFLRTAMELRKKFPDLQFVIPCANAQRLEQVSALLREAGVGVDFQLYDGQSHDAMRAADIVLQASGTATLEAMLLKRPMVVAYSLSPLTYALASRMLKVPYVSLPNLLAGERLVAEFLQYDVTPDNLYRELCRLLTDISAQQSLMQGFSRIHREIRCGADDQAAEAVLALAAERAVGKGA
ncbi:MAG: lipid-A-disaccharide synthase [Pseudomonadales bacterium]|nr:lipid-A-disaccharide synthase [Pseudomonadales bacterium]MCP5358077.1 lipid-A-disaccharide synthase [Pseudomonadales bacterium]